MVSAKPAVKPHDAARVSSVLSTGFLAHLILNYLLAVAHSALAADKPYCLPFGVNDLPFKVLDGHDKILKIK